MKLARALGGPLDLNGPLGPLRPVIGQPPDGAVEAADRNVSASPECSELFAVAKQPVAECDVPDIRRSEVGVGNSEEVADFVHDEGYSVKLPITSTVFLPIVLPSALGNNTGMLSDVLARIQKRLSHVGISESAAAKKAGLSLDAIRNIRRAVEAGKDKAGVSSRTINALAPVLDTTPSWLLEGIGPEEAAASPAPVYSQAPLVSWVSAGALLNPDVDPNLDDAPYVHAPDLDQDGDWIALRVDGDSMNRISPHDSIIFVNRKDRRLVPNACYVIGDGEGGVTYKRFRPPNRWEPVSTNPEHQPMTLPEGQEPDIVGRVRKTILSM